MTILTAVQNACAQLTLEVPAAVFSSTESDIVVLRTMANTAVSDIRRVDDWQALRKEYSFSTTAAEIQAGAVPDDYLRMVNGTIQNRTLNRPVWGPLTPQWYQREKSLPIYTSPNFAFIFRGNNIIFTPVPSAGNQIYYEYISKNFVNDVNGDGKEYFTADNDEFALDEKLIELALIYMFRASKGLDYSKEQNDYQTLLGEYTAQEQPANTISMDGRDPRYRLGAPNIKEGSWP